MARKKPKPPTDMFGETVIAVPGELPGAEWQRNILERPVDTYDETWPGWTDVKVLQSVAHRLEQGGCIVRLRPPKTFGLAETEAFAARIREGGSTVVVEQARPDAVVPTQVVDAPTQDGPREVAHRLADESNFEHIESLHGTLDLLLSEVGL